MYRRLEESLVGKKLDPQILEAFPRDAGSFFSKIFKTAQGVIEDIACCLPVLAKDLSRARPNLELDSKSCLVTEAADELFQHIFVHLETHGSWY